MLDAYRDRLRATWQTDAESLDELVTASGLRPEQDGLAATIEGMSLGGLLTARAETRGLVGDEGVTYGGTRDDADVPAVSRGTWKIDPLPLLLPGAEWAALERGLTQRALLLDAVLTDLYGPRKLLRSGLVPPEVVLAHDGFVRQTDRIAAPGRRQLVLSATDLIREASGSWLVVSDRTQAPSGAGYAMATRRIITRVMAGLHRGTDLARLRGFFHTMTAALQDASPSSVEPPRVVVLSPGPGSETAFEQSYLATLLGFPLVEADDLVMQRGRVWLRAGERLEQVDVIVRRVDAAFSDPLELRGDSQLGVPGLIEATRNRTVAVVNPIGAGVLENPALAALLPQISAELLGESLLLPMAQTWWCGDQASCSHVLANLGSLVIKPISRSRGPLQYGWQLTAGERDDLAARITAEPWAWCGQDPLHVSTAPVVTPSGLEPRRFVLRTFGVAHADDYHFLPGGLGRVAGELGQYTVANYTGAWAKDVWVLDSSAADWTPASADHPVVPHPTTRTTGLAPRVADNLFWMGRYAERAEGTARLLMVTDDFAEDHSARPQTAGALAMRVLLDAGLNLTGGRAQDGIAPVVQLRSRVLDGTRGTVRGNANNLIAVAQHIRDLLSVDTWSVLSRLDRTLNKTVDANEQLQPLLADVLESLLALAGIMSQSMIRDETWALLDAGARMERAQQTVGLLTQTLLRTRPWSVESLVVEGVLRAGESIITHRRRAAAGTGPTSPAESAIDLLLLDPINPRSAHFAVRELAADLRLLGDEASALFADAVLARLTGVAPDAMREDRSALAVLLAEVNSDLRTLSDTIAAKHFVRQTPRRAQQSAWSTPWQVT